MSCHGSCDLVVIMSDGFGVKTNSQEHDVRELYIQTIDGVQPIEAI